MTGIHGDELEGQYVAFLLNQELQQHQKYLHGTVDIYPAMNPLGINTIQRGVPLFDLDMNRIFHALRVPGQEVEYDYRGRKQVILCASAKFYNDSKCPLRKFRRGRFMRLPVPACAN